MALNYNPHNPQSLWYELAEKFGYPDIDWCEENLIWISEPANSFSNIFFIIFALKILKSNKNKNDLRYPYFPHYLIAVGIGSFIWHSTNNLLTQAFDYLGMYSLFYYIFIVNINSIYKLKLPIHLYTIILTLLSTGIFVFAYHFNISLFLSLVIPVLAVICSEIYTKKFFKYFKQISIVILILAIAFTFSMLDKYRILCDPKNHFFQGHALWHLLSSFGLYIWYNKYLEK